MHTWQWHLGSRLGSIVTPGGSDARLLSFRQEEKPPYKAVCAGILHPRYAFAGKRGSHEDHEKRERQKKEGKEKRDRVRENEKERRRVVLYACFASILKEVAQSKEKEMFKIHSIKAELSPGLHSCTH